MSLITSDVHSGNESCMCVIGGYSERLGSVAVGLLTALPAWVNLPPVSLSCCIKGSRLF